ncbi:IclR family transcriptional regulator [Natronolimnohabitans sp. A-GB9]|uniref:IclR family transcriptional regulator n=1 Tax=Natronolimnohabitans sp. A-GB9 TaxID=3069757 RepID=UPI0027B57969|nr:IclR family transcriptional regulator [Natronolimnohabitans sp. A-GB9]MDQ2052522.1 IclR family transcriptional regulator [Natronolimnohabitans sp. A-GB9]
MATEANHPVRTTEKSLALMERLREVDGARIRDLEGFNGMTKGAIHNHLSTLREHGYIIKEDDEYRLSFKFLTMSGHVRSQNDLYKFGRPKANQLAADTGMLVNLVTEEKGKGVYLYQARGDYAVNLDTHVGYRIRLHYTGVGKAILAYLPPEKVDRIVDKWGLPKATENTITDREELDEELETIRDRGYAIDHEERTEGLACIAAPILLDDTILGAISISAPTQRLGSAGFDEKIIGEVESTANELMLDLKYK